MVVGDITNLLEMFILNSSVVWVALCREKTNLLSEAEFIMKMREITDKGQLHLSKICYQAICTLYGFILSGSDTITVNGT